MLKYERHEYIKRELQEKGSVLVSDLSKELQCSEETIRRDIKEMSAKKELKKVYGGAYLPENFDKGYPIKLREVLLQKEKEQMAQKAIALINEHAVIMLDSSTTCITLATALARSKKHVTLITNSLYICNIVNSTPCNIDLILLGGQFHKLTASFRGYKTTEAIRQNYADISFVSCPAVNASFGLSDNNLNESEVRKAMLDQSKKRVLMIDHTKIDAVADILFYKLEDIDTLITDQKLTSTYKTFCEQSSIEIITI